MLYLKNFLLIWKSIGHSMENRRVLIDSFYYGLRTLLLADQEPSFSWSFHRSPEAFNNFFENSKVQPQGCSFADSKRIPRNRPLSISQSLSPLSHSTVPSVSKLNEMETILTRESNWRALYRDDIASRCERLPLTSPFIEIREILT